MGRMATFSHEQNLDDAMEAAPAFAAPDRLPVPVIGRIHGAALGGGRRARHDLRDIVIAAENAAFGFTEVRLGLIPAVDRAVRLGEDRTFGVARSLFSPASVSWQAARARELGLVHSVVPLGGPRRRGRPVSRCAAVRGAWRNRGRHSRSSPRWDAAARAGVAMTLRRSDRRTARVRGRPGKASRRSSRSASHPDAPQALRASTSSDECSSRTAVRGAIRVIRSLPRAGHRVGGGLLDADAGAAHVAAADRAVRIGPAPPGESYLKADAIIDAAPPVQRRGDSPRLRLPLENAAFAAACADAKLVFVGPPGRARSRGWGRRSRRAG